MSTTTIQQQKLGTPEVARRYGVAKRTIERWLEDETLGFPQPIDILGRRYWDICELEQFERARVGRKYQEACEARKERINQTAQRPKQKQAKRKAR
jgi:hypothetical protein